MTWPGSTGDRGLLEAWRARGGELFESLSFRTMASSRSVRRALMERPSSAATTCASAQKIGIELERDIGLHGSAMIARYSRAAHNYVL